MPQKLGDKKHAMIFSQTFRCALGTSGVIRKLGEILSSFAYAACELAQCARATRVAQRDLLTLRQHHATPHVTRLQTQFNISPVQSFKTSPILCPGHRFLEFFVSAPIFGYILLARWEITPPSCENYSAAGPGIPKAREHIQHRRLNITPR